MRVYLLVVSPLTLLGCSCSGDRRMSETPPPHMIHLTRIDLDAPEMQVQSIQGIPVGTEAGFVVPLHGQALESFYVMNIYDQRDVMVGSFLLHPKTDEIPKSSETHYFGRLTSGLRSVGPLKLRLAGADGRVLVEIDSEAVAN